MYYAITHLTTYKYSSPVTDSVMEVRKQPRSDGNQRCINMELDISPDARTHPFRDYQGNMVHTFDVPAPHTRLAIKSEAVVEIKPERPVPDALPESAWDVLDSQRTTPEFYDMLIPGKYARQTDLLKAYAEQINWKREKNPLTILRELNTQIYSDFDYQQGVTKVDSPIDIALEGRGGVCQDFAHIMLVLARQVGIPARYVSGYLFHREEYVDRSDVDASHAWVETWLPELGWVGFDPTNNLIVNDRHVRVCIGNDYAEALPARGVFKGSAETELTVKVQVQRLDELPIEYRDLSPEIVMPHYEPDYSAQQIQQEQQQQ